MKHPSHEALIELLCAEVAPERAAELSRHLESCADCRAQVEAWRAVQGRLRAWSLPQGGPRVKPSSGLAHVLSPLRWAAAALLLIAGYTVARWTTPAPELDAGSVRAQVTRELREELRAELRQFSDAQAKRQEQYQEVFARTLGELEARRLADYAGLRRDVETVAVHAEDELSSARESLARLTSLTPPRARAIE